MSDKGYTFSKEAFQLYLKWLCFATLAFIVVILLNELLVGTISRVLGYVTHVFFGRVESLPHYNVYWNNIRVLALYMFPPLVILMVGVILLGIIAFGPLVMNTATWFRFWVMFFAVLLGTTLLTLTLFSTMTANSSLFQGFAIVTYWFGLPELVSIIIVILSFLLNFAAGFLCSRALFYIAPSDFMIKEGKRYPKKIIITSFIYTVLFVLLIAIGLSYPDYWSFFAIMFFHACLWLPGLLTISTESVMNRASKKKVTNVVIIETRHNYLLIGFTLVLIILLRLILPQH